MMAVPSASFCYRAKCGCQVVFSRSLGEKLPSICACTDHRYKTDTLLGVIEDAKWARRGIEKKPSVKTGSPGK